MKGMNPKTDIRKKRPRDTSITSKNVPTKKRKVNPLRRRGTSNNQHNNNINNNNIELSFSTSHTYNGMSISDQNALNIKLSRLPLGIMLPDPIHRTYR
eukprot:UN15847